MSKTRSRNIGILRIGLVLTIAAVWIGSEHRLLAAPNRHRPSAIVVTNSAELEAALSPGNEGKRILVRAGEYLIGHSLTVPDRASLIGEGDMTFDGSGSPAGIGPSDRTVLRSSPDLVGDVLTLGDGATLQKLVIEDVARSVPFFQAGNPVVVVSRAAGDFISASILECEIVNQNPRGIAPSGPTGEGLAVFTRNLNAGQDPKPDEGSVLWVRMSSSIVRSPAGGGGVFGINFASDSQIGLVLERNVIAGELTATAGVGRPDAVTGSSVVIRSTRNLYRSDTATPTELGWNLIGGADAPSPLFVSEPSTFNSLEIHSRHDAIVGYLTGISVMGGRRFSPLTAPSSSNRVDMSLRATRFDTTDADLTLFGAASFVDGIPAGDGNTARVLVRDARGSGPRSNIYADGSTPNGDPGVGNRLEIVGSEKAFARTNDGFEPPPPAEFFTVQR
ncbi:MAG TPA: hypothetical protein VIA45_12505 [Thermoanaerobaculia bacterium]|jgi:hypothetical protein